MSPSTASSDHQVRTIIVDGQKYFVALRVGYDGIEYVGRLRFTDASTDIVYQDHGGIPGVSIHDTVAKAKEFSDTALAQRCYRALSEKRRFGKLRSATDKMIEKIKYMNRVAVGLEKGLLDPEGAKLELDQAENDLMEIVKPLRQSAGVEDLPTRAD